MQASSDELTSDTQSKFNTMHMSLQFAAIKWCTRFYTDVNNQ